MANIREMISTFLAPGFVKEAVPAPNLPDNFNDRLDYDLIGLSDSDAMWYYELRKWRGRD